MDFDFDLDATERISAGDLFQASPGSFAPSTAGAGSVKSNGMSIDSMHDNDVLRDTSRQEQDLESYIFTDATVHTDGLHTPETAPGDPLHGDCEMPYLGDSAYQYAGSSVRKHAECFCQGGIPAPANRHASTKASQHFIGEESALLPSIHASITCSVCSNDDGILMFMVFATHGLLEAMPNAVEDTPDCAEGGGMNHVQRLVCNGRPLDTVGLLQLRSLFNMIQMLWGAAQRRHLKVHLKLLERLCQRFREVWDEHTTVDTFCA